MELFQVTCTTCRARLRVNDPAAIGQIVSCPKCRSMVLVAPPTGWTGGTADASGSAVSAVSLVDSTRVTNATPGVTVPVTKEPAPPAAQPKTPAATAATPPAAPPVVAPQAPDWMVPPARTARQWFLAASVALTAAVVAGAIWMWRSTAPLEAPSAAPPPQVAARIPKPTAAPEPQPAPAVQIELDPRWLPDDTRAVVSFAPASWTASAPLPAWLSRASHLWNVLWPALADSFGWKFGDVTRATFALSQFNDPAQALVVVHLAAPLAADFPAAETSDVPEVARSNQPARMLAAAAWPHPFIQVGPQTLVTGPAETLQALIARAQPQHVAPRVVDLARRGTSRPIALALDMTAWRAAGTTSPPPELQLLLTTVPRWQLLRDLPVAGALWIDPSSTLSVEARLVGDNETVVPQFLAAWQDAVAQTGRAAAASAATLDERLQQGTLAPPAADALDIVLTALVDALNSAAAGQEKDEFWARLSFNRTAAEFFPAALAAAPVFEADRVAQVRAGSVAALRAAWQGLAAREKAEGAFPAGAGGAAQLSPDSRLSWIASLLPYYGHRDWHRELSFFHSWNDPVNRPVTSRALAEFVNPAFGATLSAAGFPTTHFAGLAGLGTDAGMLPADDPRAGLFGFSRELRPNQLVDGASQTIALVGVAERHGPWAAGGDASVRSLTQAPYVNGPDGLGTGQPDGMYVVMADGAVRFISKDIDPHVVEQLATINGGALGAAGDLALVPVVDHSGQVAAAAPAPAPADPAPVPPPDPNAQPPKTLVHEEAPPEQLTADQIAERLSVVLPAFELNKTTLAALADFVWEMSTVPLSLDVEGLAAEGVGADDTITVKLANVSLAEGLSAALDTLELAWVADSGGVFITTAARLETELAERRYDVAALLAGSEAAELRAIVERFVAPATWQSGGGQGTLQVADTQLVARQTRFVHRQLDAFLVRLATVRLNRRRPEDLPLVARIDDDPRLLLPVTVTFATPTPLAHILADLGTAAGLNLVLDRRALAAAGQGPEIETTSKAVKLPFAQALDAVLMPLDLTWRFVDERTIQVTTNIAAAATLQTEIHPVPAALTAAIPPEKLAQHVRHEVLPDTWREAGGRGEIAFDRASSSLIVLHNQAAQLAIYRWLNRPAE